MDSSSSKKQDTKPMGFGKTMLASALGMIIAMQAMSLISFIVLAVSLASALSSASDDQMPVTGSNLAIEVDLTQPIFERKPNEVSALFGDRGATSIEQILCALDMAATDDNVNAIYLHLGGSALDWAQAEEIMMAFDRFYSKCDKPIFAYGETMSQSEYFLASAADKVCLHPSGGIDFRGIGAEVIFYKGLLDKLGVHMELIRPTSCAYKSAGETYVRTDMSDANREQVRSYVSSTWNFVADIIASNRKLTVQKINDLADNLGAYIPTEALAAGLLDTLCFEQDMKTLLHEKTAATKIVKANRYAAQAKPAKSNNHIAVIYAEGNVVGGKGNGTTTAVYGDDIVKALNDAARDSKVKAIVLRVNSPGGAVGASEAMTHAVREAKKVKPVIVSMSGVAASAGYEMSCFATKIVAHPTTLTGSIGVFATVPEVGNLLRQKLGITTDTVLTNKNAASMSIFRPLSTDARAKMQQSVEDFYITFTQRVADGRGLRRTYVDSIARGRVWTGLQALENGLVDTLGGLPLAIELAAQEAEIVNEGYRIKTYPAEKTLWEQIIDRVDDNQEEEIKARLNAIIPYYSDLESWSRMEPLQARLPFIINLN